MSDKITAYFGADVSEVEAKMMLATRATKSYEAAVKGVGDNSPFSKLNEEAPHVLRHLKHFGGLFKAIGESAMLVPGIGIAAVGVGAAVWGVEKIRDYYKEAAALSKEILDNIEKASKIEVSRIKGNTPEQDNAEALKEAQTRLKEIQDGLTKVYPQGRNKKIISETREMTDAEAKEAAELEVKIQEGLTAAAKFKKEAVDKKEKTDKAEKERAEKSRDEAYRAASDKLDVAEKAAEFEALSDEDKIKRLRLEKKMRMETDSDTIGMKLRVIAIDKQIAEITDKIDERADKVAKATEKINQEIETTRYNRIWKRATLEQKLVQAQKEGRAAQAAYDKEKTAENLLALEKAKTKWRDLKDEVDAAAKSQDNATKVSVDPLATNGRTRGEDGKLHLRGAVVSKEDAMRSDATRAKNAKLNQEAQRGRIRDSKPIGDEESLATTNQILTMINNKMSPKSIK